MRVIFAGTPEFARVALERLQGAGHAVVLGANGTVLAVGAPYDSSAATGIDGERDDDSAPQRGAVWLY